MRDLADRALKGLPRDQWCRQVVVRFCQGLLDKEAGHTTLLPRPEDIQEATEMVKEHPFSCSLCFGKGSRKDNPCKLADEYIQPHVSQVVNKVPNRDMSDLKATVTGLKKSNGGIISKD